MKAPVKDRNTVPWMSSAEIPAVKLVLSEWRKLRRSVFWRESVPCDPSDIPSYTVDAASLLQSIFLAERELNRKARAK